MARWTFINNEFKKEEEALVSYRDLSIQRGYGLFEFLGIREGRLLFWEDHYQRLQNSSSTLHLPLPYDSVKLKEIIAELLLRNGTGKHEGIRITLTGGNADDGYSLSHPNLIISQTSFTPPSAGQVKKGISLITWDHRRQLPRVKS